MCECPRALLIPPPSTFLFLLLLHHTWADTMEKAPVDWLLQQMVNRSYDTRVRPAGTHRRQVTVNVNAYLRSMSSMDFQSMTIDLQLTMRQKWNDPRLAYAQHARNTPFVPKFLLLTDREQIWVPDTFFQNEEKAYRHDIDKPNVLIRVSPEGDVLYSQRLSLTLNCPMDIRNFPMDVQECHLELASYAYTDEEMLYQWDPNPIELRPGHQYLHSYTLDRLDTGDTLTGTITGNYSTLRATFTLSRHLGYYVMQIYLPSILLVVISWVSFWLDHTAVPARVTLGVTTLLTMTAQAAAISSSLPVVAYVKAIDVWIGACLLFIFATVIEFAIVSYLADRSRCPWHSESERGSVNIPLNAFGEEDADDVFEFGRQPATEADIIDIRCRVGFPFAFLLFTVLYWFTYM